MLIQMLVSISRSDGFNAHIGQEIDVDDPLAQELMTNEQAEPVNAIKLPRGPKPAPIDAVPGSQSGSIDLADGVSDGEATLAGKALSRRRKAS